MKTKRYSKIKLLILFAIPLLIIASISAVFAGFSSSGDTNDCPNWEGQGSSCVTFHNRGYTGANGATGFFKNGVPFPTFNGYRDQKTEDGRSFQEMQFMYIESVNAAMSGFPRTFDNFPLTPWENGTGYIFSQGTSHTINFTNSNPVRIGFWGYIHNNATARSTLAATGTNIRLTGWSSSVPQTQYNPRYTLSANNTKPTTVWSDVTLKSTRPFTLNPVEGYVMRAADSERSGIQFIQLDEPIDYGQLVDITHGGLRINSIPGNSGGKFDASEKMYALVYIEFDAVPSAGICRSLQIVEPDEVNDGRSGPPAPTMSVGENGFQNEQIQIQADFDQGVVSNFLYVSTEETITFSEPDRGATNITTNSTSMLMNGGPNEQNGETSDVVTVWALDQNDNMILECSDSFRVEREIIPEPPECAKLNTDPGINNIRDLRPNVPISISIDTFIDTEGKDITDVNGEQALIEYCFDGAMDWQLHENINLFQSPENPSCFVTTPGQSFTVTPLEEGTMTIRALFNNPELCSDRFEVTEEPIPGEGICRNLNFRQDTFDLRDQSIYCVNLDVDDEAITAGYENDIEWNVERDGEVLFDPPIPTKNEFCLNVGALPQYDFRPGDILTARASRINYEEKNCEDDITSKPDGEDICEDFRLDTDRFERGEREEVCISRLDYPFFDNILDYSTPEGHSGSFIVDDDLCFILDEDLTEDASRIDVFVPGFEDECRDSLRVVVKPPEFDKEIRAEGTSRYVNRAFGNLTHNSVDYRISYKHFNISPQDVRITDTIGRNGFIEGFVGNARGETRGTSQGIIDYRPGSMRIEVEGNEVVSCAEILDELIDAGLNEEEIDAEMDETLCYDGNIGQVNGVTIQNVPSGDELRITYTGDLDSAVNPENCGPGGLFLQREICGELYDNTATFDDKTDSGRDTTQLLIPCPFLITRAGGDVIFENPLRYGIDTLYCSEQPNVPFIIVPDEPIERRLIQTGSSIITAFDDRLCDQQAESDETGISALVCEVSGDISEELTQFAIVDDIQSNKDRFARYIENLNSTGTVSNESQLSGAPGNVYVKTNGDLHLDGGITPLTLSGEARTIVVEDHDVYIDSNVEFADALAGAFDPENVANLAIIVINGSIIIDPEVENTNGIFFVQEGERANSGKICEAPKAGNIPCGTEPDNADFNATNRLIHNGSIYGDIEHLLQYRVFTGDPALEEAAILIRFDQRIYLNPPPVLQEIGEVFQRTF